MSNEWKTRKVKELQEIEGDGNRIEGNRGRYLKVLFSIFYLEPKEEKRIVNVSLKVDTPI
jgi:hypothetical protein